MSFLSNPSNLQDISNQFTEYSWNITSIAGNLSTYDTIILTFGNGSSVTTTIQQKTLDGIIIALNQLGVSSFYYDIVGGSTFIKTYNDVQAFTTLEILSSTAVTSVQLFYSVYTPFSSTGDVTIDNGGTFNTGILSNPQSVPTTNATSLILLGDNISVNGNSPTIGSDINVGINVLVRETIGASITTLIDNNYYGTPFLENFTLSNNNASYIVGVGYVSLDANYSVLTTSTNGSVIIDYGQGTIPIWLNPTSQTFDYTNIVSVGQLVQVAGVAPNSGGVLTIRIRIRRQDLANGTITTLYDNTYSSGASFNDSFTIALGYAYQILVTDL
jgi:hypothetical protein